MFDSTPLINFNFNLRTLQLAVEARYLFWLVVFLFCFVLRTALLTQWALCTIRSHGTKLNILVSKLRSGTSKTKAGPGELVRVALFWKSHCATCSPVYIILYHVTGSCKGPILQMTSDRLDCSQSPIFPCDRRCGSLSSMGRYLGPLMRAKLGRVQNARG